MSVPIRVLSSIEPDLMQFVRRIVLVGGVATSCAVVACDRPAAAPRSDSAALARPAALDSVTASAADSGWNADAGALLVLPMGEDGLSAGAVLRNDATDATVGDTVGVAASLGDGRFELFSRSGVAGVATVTLGPPPHVDAGCTAWPSARLTPPAATRLTNWTVAFAAGRVTAVALDSIEGLPPRDSARLAVGLARLASGLRDDTSATFRGLPFVVLRAYRAMALDTAFVVATLARRVNQEDSPKEERLVIIVNMVGADATQWTVAWHERAAGREDELVVAEPLMAFRTVRGNETSLLFGRDDGDAPGAAVLARRGATWRVRWQSAIAGCG